jgi:hypothetical protein
VRGGGEGEGAVCIVHTQVYTEGKRRGERSRHGREGRSN